MSKRIILRNNTLILSRTGQAPLRIDASVRMGDGQDLSPEKTKELGRALIGLCLDKPNVTAGEFVLTGDYVMGHTVGIEPAAALAWRIWRAMGGPESCPRSMRLDGTQAEISDLFAEEREIRSKIRNRAA